MANQDHLTAVQKLFIEHISMVKCFVLSLVPDPGEAEDIVQEAFLTVTAKAEDFELGTNFAGWVLTIARFKVHETWRRQKTARARLSTEAVDLLSAEAPEALSPTSRDAARLRALDICLEKLSPRARTMIDLQYRSQLKPAAIAEEIGWRADSVYVALSRARALLRTCLEEHEPKVS